MRYSFVSAAVLALASAVFAQESTDGFDIITSPTEGQKVPAGKPFEIVWQPGTKPEYLNGTATIVLLQGATPQNLQLGDTIIAGVKNSAGKYTWNVPASAGNFATYGIRITLDDDKSTTQKEDTIFQYSFPFQITSASGSASGTTTIILGTGTAYTPTPTPSSTISANNTTSITSTSTSASASATNSSNFTLTTSSTRTTTTGSSPTTSRPAQQTTNAAVANAVSGGLALVGGVILAFAL